MTEARQTLRKLTRRVVYILLATGAGASAVGYEYRKTLADVNTKVACRDDFTESCRQFIEEKYFADKKLVSSMYDAYAFDIQEEVTFTDRMMKEGYTVLALQIDSKQVRLDKLHLRTMDVPPYINGGRTYVQFRFLAEQMGADVKPVHLPDGRWRGTAIMGNKTLVFDEGAQYILVNDRKLPTCVGNDCVAIENKDGRLCIPIRFVAEALGAEYIWLDHARKVVVAWR